MKQLRLILNCARLSAATALILFFLTSCTNYWLHAVTQPFLNDTETSSNSTGINQPFSMNKSAPQEEEQSSTHQARPNLDTALVIPTSSTGTNQEHFNGKENSLGMNQPSPTNEPVDWEKAYYQARRKLNKHRILFVKQLSLTYHHEGFFWRCWFTDQKVEATISKFIFVNQPPSKCCLHAYHSPFPSTVGKTSSEFESAIVYRRLWSTLMFLAVIFITIGCIIITLKAFSETYQMYKIVGAIFLLSGTLNALSIIMYAYWISAVRQMMAADEMTIQVNTGLNIGKTEVKYGWSFMAAPVGILFSLIAGLSFLKVTGIAYKESSSII
ncbi:transmembrane protein 182-like isoform X1 [Carcharodon carcharias]|uniref:transmembrane protein 182-like isoform X1 n=1 Tax=Carcharodon carcharias TaxID=13397 RepID=UPI001B7DD576|nr:transmembrane protein 182-like isoform X1 [Carcharodon carcharias]